MSDLRLAFRHLTSSPGYTVVAVLTLALGIGLNTSLFSILNVLLLRPLPFPHGDRLVRVFGSSPEAHDWALTAGTYRDLRRAHPDFESLALFGWWGATLTEPGRPAELLLALRTSAEFLPTLEVRPALGRWFSAEEDKPGSAVALISHSLWRRRFAGDPQVVGRTVLIDREPVTIIGVMPAELAAPTVFGVVDVWRPIGLTAEGWENRDDRWLHAVARLRPGDSLAHANAVVRTIAQGIAREHPRETGVSSLCVVPLHGSAATGTDRAVTWFTVGLSAFVLLIACGNLANLQLARAARRLHEFAVRSALGASRFRLLRPLLVESLALSLLGGAAGLLVALECNHWVGRHLVFFNSSPGLGLPVDWRVLAFAGAVSIASGLLFGLVPAWLMSRAPLQLALKESARGATGGRREGRVRHGLVAGQFALALILLTGTGLILGGIDRYIHRSPGWEVPGVAYGYVATQTPKYRDLEQARDFYERACERLRQIPGVQSVGFGWDMPIFPNHPPRPFTVEGRPSASVQQAPLAYFNGVLPGYFAALGIPQPAGRDFTRRDRSDAPKVAIVNETLARTFWPGESALGKRIASLDPTAPQRTDVWLEVVGVVGDTRWAGSLSVPPTRMQVYVPFAQQVWNWGAVVLRTAAPPETLIEPMRRAIAELDPDIPVWEPRTAREEIDRRLSNSKLTSQLLGGIATLGLFLAGLGVYGVVSHLVTQRTPEIGLRMALGADHATVYRLIFGSGVRMVLAGVVVGLVGAAALTRAISTAAPEIPLANPLVFAAVVLPLAAVALVACWLPARRAMRVDPVTALRAI